MERVTVEQAVELILAQTEPMKETEEISLLEASGRIVVEDIYAQFDNPPFDRAPIDGYACRSADVAAASREHPVVLEVLEEIDAGQYSEVTVGPGQAVRIMTGAAIPDGCDCCIWQEQTDYGEETVEVYKGAAAWENYCYRGEDFKKGTLMVKAGTKLNYISIAVLASMGHATVQVYRTPRIALLTSGDEVTPPGEKLLPGKIYNSNQTMVAARLMELGIKPFIMKSIPDQPEIMAEALKRAAKEADIIITTGGVSVGKKDIMHDALPMIGAQRVFWRVLIKPGTPTIFSVYEGVPVISLSGNPFGAAANLELLIRPMLAKMMHDASVEGVRIAGRMADPFPKAGKIRRLIRAIWKDGIVYLPDGLHASGVLSSMQGCNCIVDIQPGTAGLKPGDEVEVVLL